MNVRRAVHHFLASLKNLVPFRRAAGRRRSLSLSLACLLPAALLAMAAAPALAQAYPEKTVRIVVPYPPGGGTDNAARVLAQKLSETWVQSVVVENRSGAAGNIGIEAALQAPRDGYTLIMAASGTITTNISLFAKMGFDPVKDLTPIALVTPVLLVLVTNPQVPVANLQELIALAKQKPGGLSVASPGAGTSGHLASELFKMETGADITQVLYRGTGPALTDLLGGTVSMMFADVLIARPHIDAGKLRALGFASRLRSSVAPGLVPIADQGVPDFDVTGWLGLFAPAGVPEDIVAKINRDVRRIMETDEVRTRLAIDTSLFPTNEPGPISALIKSEIEKWGKVVKATGAKLQ